LWTDQLDPDAQLVPDAVVDPAAHTVAALRHHRQELSAETSAALLTTLPSAFHAGTEDALLTALALAGSAYRGEAETGHTAVLVELDGYGRDQLVDGMDLGRTVGH
jgi:hypothetical protein